MTPEAANGAALLLLVVWVAAMVLLAISESPTYGED